MVPVSTFSDKHDLEKQNLETYILDTLSRDRENVETFRVNSESKLWDANNHPYEGLNSGFSLNTQEPSDGSAGFT